MISQSRAATRTRTCVLLLGHRWVGHQLPLLAVTGVDTLRQLHMLVIRKPTQHRQQLLVVLLLRERLLQDTRAVDTGTLAQAQAIPPQCGRPRHGPARMDLQWLPGVPSAPHPTALVRLALELEAMHVQPLHQQAGMVPLVPAAVGIIERSGYSPLTKVHRCC